MQKEECKGRSARRSAKGGVLGRVRGRVPGRVHFREGTLRHTQTRSLATGHVRIYTYRSAYGKIPHVAWEEASMQGGFPLMEVSAIFCRCCTERVPNGVVFDRKGSQNGPKWSRKGAKSDQNGARREPKRGKGTYKGPLRKSIGFCCEKRVPVRNFWEPFWTKIHQNPLKNDVGKTSKKQMSKIPVFIRFGLRK